MSPIPLDRQAGLRKFQHDAEQEGPIGFDPISPLKQILGDAFEVQMDRLTREVFLRFGLPWWMEEKKVALASS